MAPNPPCLRASPVLERHELSAVALDAFGRRVEELHQNLGQLVCILVPVVVCTLALVAAAIGMVLAMTRDNNLPFSQHPR